MIPVDEYLAVPDEERERELAALSPEELLRLGVELYNAGHFWHAHEAWEQVWMDAEQPLRAFYQGLIQVTAAFVHVTRNEYPGSVRLLEAGIEKLEAYPASFMGIELGKLVVGSRWARERLLALGEKGIVGFDRGLIPRIEWTPSP